MADIINIEPISLLGIVGAELFKKRIAELASRHDTKRKFVRALEQEILPTVRLVFDHHVAKDVLEAARQIYGRRSHAKTKEQSGQPARPLTQVRQASGVQAGRALPSGTPIRV